MYITIFVDLGFAGVGLSSIDSHLSGKYILTMTYQTFTFPQFPEYSVFVGYYTDIKSETLKQVKEQLVAGNQTYNYCFVNTAHLISLDQLSCSLHRSIQNHELNRMKAKTLNTEILYNLSPTNNINEALKRFGVDESRLDIIVIKVLSRSDDEAQCNTEIEKLLEGSSTTELSNVLLTKLVDLKKFLKLFKIQLTNEDISQAQQRYSREAVAASLLRGC